MLSVPWLVVFFSASWIVFKLFYRILWRSPLDNLPGPPRTSILTGASNFNLCRTGF